MLRFVVLGSVPQTVSLSGKQRLPLCQQPGELEPSEGNFQATDRHFLTFFAKDGVQCWNSPVDRGFNFRPIILSPHWGGGGERELGVIIIFVTWHIFAL